MKLKKFLEYVDNTNSEVSIKLNDNELKYLKDKSFLYIKNGEKLVSGKIRKTFHYYVNYKQIKKLESGEFLVVNDKVKCSTIQTLIKYTYNSVVEAKEWVDKFLSESYTNPHPFKENIILWMYDNELWAEQDTSNKEFLFTSYLYYTDLYKKYHLGLFEIGLLVRSKFKSIGLDDYNIDNSVNEEFNYLYEHAHSENDIIVEFNDNELKYLNSKGCLNKINDDHYFNCLLIKKLDNGEYYLPDEKIKCNTIQSLVKFTQDYIKDLSDRIDYLINNSETKKSSNSNFIIYWHLKNINKLWAKQSSLDNWFIVDTSQWSYLIEQIAGSKKSLRVKYFFEYKLNEYTDLKNYNVKYSYIYDI